MQTVKARTQFWEQKDLGFLGLFKEDWFSEYSVQIAKQTFFVMKFNKLCIITQTE